MAQIETTWNPIVGTTASQFIAESAHPFSVTVIHGPDNTEQVPSSHDGITHFVTIEVRATTLVEVQSGEAGPCCICGKPGCTRDCIHCGKPICINSTGPFGNSACGGWIFDWDKTTFPVLSHRACPDENEFWCRVCMEAPYTEHEVQMQSHLGWPVEGPEDDLE